MSENFKCFSVKNLDYYNITVHSLVCNKLSVKQDISSLLEYKYRLSFVFKSRQISKVTNAKFEVFTKFLFR
jgi:hypothetical protein